MENHNLTQLKNLVKFTASFISAIAKTTQDHRLTFTDLPAFFDPILKGYEAFDNITNIAAQLDALTDSELLELKESFLTELRADGIDPEHTILDEMVFDALQFVMLLIRLVKSSQFLLNQKKSR